MRWRTGAAGASGCRMSRTLPELPASAHRPKRVKFRGNHAIGVMSDSSIGVRIEPAQQPGEASMPDTSTVTTAQHWWARLAVVLAIATVVVLVVGGLRSLVAFVAAVAGIAVALAGGWLFLSRRGVIRWVGGVVAVAAPVGVLVLYLAKGVVWPVIVVVVLAAATAAAARAALAASAVAVQMPERETPPPTHPFLVMNPRSGGGKVARFELDTKARRLGAEVALLDGPDRVDVRALSARAAQDGADLLGVAGGDGTQALVAGVAAERDLPFLVVSAGTRNHFAMDLGLDRDHPDACLGALDDGVELLLDLGDINGRTFVNNASFGAYAEIVQSDGYRDDKRGTTLRMLPDLLTGHDGPRLTLHIDDEPPIEGPQAVLVSNNPYADHDLAGLGRRPRMDTGMLGVMVVTVDNAMQAAALVRGRHAEGLQRFTAKHVVVTADTAQIAVGIDGEAVMMNTPTRCSIRAAALRVRVPRQRAGGYVPRAAMDPGQVLHRALQRS